VEIQRGGFRIPGIAAEAEDRQPLAIRSAGRDMDAVELLPLILNDQPLGRWRQRAGTGHHSRREEQLSLRQEQAMQIGRSSRSAATAAASTFRLSLPSLPALTRSPTSRR
jgi:hypothetical protein